jgi:hypothetical protein
MIIASLEHDNDPAVLIGLTKRNMEELLKGRPILKSAEDNRIPVTIIIVGGETEESIMAELKQHFDIPDGVVEDRKSEYERQQGGG